MNESAAKSALSNGRQPIDLEEFERRIRGPAPYIEPAPQPPQSSADPLAELAKIVDSVDNPLHDIFGATPESGKTPPVSEPAEQAATGDDTAARYRPPYPAIESNFTPEEAPDILRNVAGQMREPDTHWVDDTATGEFDSTPAAPAAALPDLPERPAHSVADHSSNYTGWDPSAYQPIEPPPFQAQVQAHEPDQQPGIAEEDNFYPPQPSYPAEETAPADAGHYEHEEQPPHDITGDHPASADPASPQEFDYTQDGNGFAENVSSGQPHTEEGHSPVAANLPAVAVAGTPQLPEANPFFQQPESDPVDEFEKSVAQLIAARNAVPQAADENDRQPANAMPPVPVPVPMPHVDQHGLDQPTPQASPLPDIPSQIALPESAAGHPDEEFAGSYPAELPSTEMLDEAAAAMQTQGQVPEDDENVAPWETAAGATSAAEAEKRSRKPLYFTAAAIGVMVIGIGATLGMRGSGNGEVPTIAAIKSPLKVPGQQVASNDKPAAANILGGNKANTKASNVVAKNDEPIDLTQVPAGPKKERRIREEELSRKINLADRNVARPIAKVRSTLQRKASGYFPEPRRVRTVMVRPDGTLIDPTTTANTSAAAPSPSTRKEPPPSAAPAAQQSRLPILAAREAQPAVRRATRTAKPASRKSTNRAGAASNRSRPARTAALDLTPKPARTAAPAARPASNSGGYAVQLAARGNQAAAQSAARKIKQRFGSVLNGRTPSLQRAVVRNKTFWRVRVTGMDRKSAVALCSRLQGRGGKCFVARN